MELMPHEHSGSRQRRCPRRREVAVAPRLALNPPRHANRAPGSWKLRSDLLGPEAHEAREVVDEGYDGDVVEPRVDELAHGLGVAACIGPARGAFGHRLD